MLVTEPPRLDQPETLRTHGALSPPMANSSSLPAASRPALIWVTNPPRLYQPLLVCTQGVLA
jgi:hypothetical protein